MHDHEEVPLIDQLAEQFLERLRRGEHPTVDEYVSAHPQLQEELRDLLPTLEFLEEFKPSEGDKQPDEEAESVSLPSPLQQLGEYRILKEIGRGGMGVVYEAEQLSLGRHVALKVLPKRAVRDRIAIERFQREARAAAKLQHPNIVPIIDISSEDDVNYYAMQFVRGRSLNEIQDNVRDLRGESAVPAATMLSDKIGAPERIDTSTMGGREYWRSVARLGVQVSRALDYAHANGVIHRDIKPSNLLLDDEGTLWVTDFGLAKTNCDGLTLTGDVVGTIRYMSPERFKGQCDERADVFSVGATLYELLVLEPAFHSPDRLRLIERITKEDPSSPRSIDPSVPIDLETIVLKALEKDPRRRYQSASDLCEDLSRFLRHQPIRARRTSAVGRAFRWAARNRALAITMTCLLTTLLAVAVSSVVVAIRMGDLVEESNEARTTIERQLYRSQVQSAVRAIETGRIALARRRLNDTSESLRGWEWRHVESRLEGGIGSPLPAQQSIVAAQFAADAKVALLHVARPDGSYVYRVVQTSTWEPVMELPAGATIYQAELSREGEELVLLGEELQVWSVSRNELLHRSAAPPKYLAGTAAGDYLYPLPSHLELRNHATGAVTGRIDGPPWWAEVQPGGQHIVVAFERSVGLFRASDMVEVGKRLQLPAAGNLHDGCFAPDGKTVAVVSAGGRFYVFGVSDNGLVRKHELTDYVGSPSTACFSKDGRRLVLGTRVGGLFVWDVATGKLVRQLVGHQASIRSVAIEPVTGQLVSCDASGSHRGWSFEAQSYDVLRGHQSFVYPVAYSHDGRRLVSGGWDGYQNEAGALRWWDGTTGEPIVARLQPGQFVTSLASAPNRVVASVQSTCSLPAAIVYDELTGEALHQFVGHSGDQVARVYVHPDGQRVLTLGAYEVAMLWHIDSGKVERQWPLVCDGSNGQAAAFTPDGKLLALSSMTGTVRIIDLATGEERLRWLAHDEYLTDLAFAADGQTLVSSSCDDSIALWNLDGTLQGRLLGHGDDVMCIAMSPDGTRIASGGRDGDLLLWDAEHLDLVARFNGHSDYIYDCAWSLEGERIVTSSGDSTLRLWTVDSMARQAAASREHRVLVARLAPLVLEQLQGESSVRALWQRWQGDAARSPREREIAHQLLMQHAQRMK